MDEYVHAHPERFRILNLPVPPPLAHPAMCLTVDTPEDYERMCRIYEALFDPDTLIETEAVIHWCAAQGGLQHV